MNDEAAPTGLSRNQLKKLKELSEHHSNTEYTELMKRGSDHVDQAVRVHAANHFVSIKLARLIHARFKDVELKWDSLDVDAQYWLRGAVAYFVDAQDDENDFRSPIGFEDDAEVLNACVRFAGMEQLVISEEEF